MAQARGRASVRGPGLGHRPVESAGSDHRAAGRRAAPERVRAAVLDRLVAVSPVVRIQLPRYEKDRIVPLSVARRWRPSPRHARALSDHGPRSGWARTPDRRAAGPPRGGRRLSAPHRANRVAVHPGVERGAERAEDSPVAADRPAAPSGRRRAGSSPSSVSGGRGRNDLHHREGRLARSRLLRPQPVRSGGDRGEATEGDDEPRPATPLRPAFCSRPASQSWRCPSG